MKDKSLNQQLDDLILLGNKNSLYEAADWLRGQVDAARLIFNKERERQEHLAYLGRYAGESLTLPQLRGKLASAFPSLTIPQAHSTANKWLREHGRPNTVQGVLVS